MHVMHNVCAGWVLVHVLSKINTCQQSQGTDRRWVPHLNSVACCFATYLVDARKKLLEVGLDNGGVLGLTQDLQQIVITQKVEPAQQ